MRWADDGRAGTMIVLAVAATLLYAASRTAAAALAGSGAGRPGWRAVGHWVPIAVTAVVAALRGQPDIAVALTFATSVGCLSFVLGVLLYISPMDQLPATRRAWPFVLPAALLALIAGFSGHVSAIHATAMMLLGAALVSVWRDPALRETPTPNSTVPVPDTRVRAFRTSHWFRAAEFVIALALTVVGAWYAINGTVRASSAARIFPAATLTVVILSPLVTLPMLNPSPQDAPRDQTGSAASTLVAVALLNLCGLLPLLAFTWLLKTGLAGPVMTTVATPASTTSALMQASQPLPYPLTEWRVDAVVLTVLGFVLIPVSLGRWELRRAEAVGLIAGYACYLVLVALASVRP